MFVDGTVPGSELKDHSIQSVHPVFIVLLILLTMSVSSSAESIDGCFDVLLLNSEELFVVHTPIVLGFLQMLEAPSSTLLHNPVQLPW